MNKPGHEAGLTLLQLVLFLGVSAIVAEQLMSRRNQEIRTAKIMKCKSRSNEQVRMFTIASAEDRYFREHGRYFTLQRLGKVGKSVNCNPPEYASDLKQLCDGKTFREQIFEFSVPQADTRNFLAVAKAGEDFKKNCLNGKSQRFTMDKSRKILGPFSD